MPPAFQAIEEMVCKVAEQKWIEDKATGAICSAITKQLPIPDCPSTLEKNWDKIVTMCPHNTTLSPCEQWFLDEFQHPQPEKVAHMVLSSGKSFPSDAGKYTMCTSQNWARSRQTS